MALVNLKGSRIMTGLATSPPTLADPGEGGGKVHVWVETVETTASDSVSSTYLLARLPSNARILGLSRFSWDDLATTGSPTMDLGVYNITGSAITNDDDALSDGHAVSSASSASAVGNVANYGKRLWEFVNGQTSDPKCDLDVKAVLRDAALTAAGAGTLTVEFYYTTD
jgi:hypothetical protein